MEQCREKRRGKPPLFLSWGEGDKKVGGGTKKRSYHSLQKKKASNGQKEVEATLQAEKKENRARVKILAGEKNKTEKVGKKDSFPLLKTFRRGQALLLGGARRKWKKAWRLLEERERRLRRDKIASPRKKKIATAFGEKEKKKKKKGKSADRGGCK